MPPEKTYRISGKASAILLVCAGIADLLTLIPLVGLVIGPIYWILASFYFWKSGLGLVNGRRLATSIVSMGAELFPVAQALPTIFVGTAAIIAMIRVEDKTGISVPSTHAGPKANVAGVRQPPPRIPINQGGMRPPNGGLAA